MFALTADDQLFLKADAQTKIEFESAGMLPFTYEKKGGKWATMSYYGVSEELLEDKEALLEWAQKAVNAAVKSKKENAQKSCTPRP